jgi:predicted DNA-binding protein with PD1-like motif
VKPIIKENHLHLLRFDKGDEVISGIASYCKQNNILSAIFTALGACQRVTLAYYDLEKKTYLDQTMTKDLEITGITGNVSRMNEDTMIHAHGTFSDESFSVFGGHVKSLIVSATCEVQMIPANTPARRQFDKETGLNLLR